MHQQSYLMFIDMKAINIIEMLLTTQCLVETSGSVGVYTVVVLKYLISNCICISGLTKGIDV